MGSSQTVLPLVGGDGRIADRAQRVALFGEFLPAIGVCGLIDHELPAPGSAAGYSPSAHVLPLNLMLSGGGRTLEDLRLLRSDEGPRCLLRLKGMPSSDATGAWLRRVGAKEGDGLAGLQRVDRCVFRRLLRNDERIAQKRRICARFARISADEFVTPEQPKVARLRNSGTLVPIDRYIVLDRGIHAIRSLFGSFQALSAVE